MAISAALVEDGLYLRSKEKDKAAVEVAAGSEIKVGTKLPAEDYKIEIRARSKANDWFDVIAYTPGKWAAIGPQIVVVCGDIVLSQTGENIEGDGEGNPLFVHRYGPIDAISANKLSSLPNVTIWRLVRPDHKIEVSFASEKKSFKAGQLIQAVCRVKNAGTQPIVLRQSIDQDGYRKGMFKIEYLGDATNVKDISQKSESVDLVLEKRLQPQETFTVSENISRLYTLNKAGTYKFKGTYLLQFMSAGKKPRVIWEEGASGEFDVVVK
jgi:hypothetical protein